MKINKKTILELLIIFIITLVYNLVIQPLNQDEIWNYGFAYNIATGLLPYKDFNMVITPLYPFLGSIFLIIFGKSLLIYHIFNAITCTIIFYLIKKLIPRGYYIVYAFILLFSLPNYSLFCVLLLYLLMLMEEKKSNNYLIGIVLALTFLTKQHIGIMLCIPTLFTKNKEVILKRIIGFLIPTTIFIIYLLATKSLYQFIDYAFLGISSFGEKNLLITIWIILPLVSIIYLIYKYIKTKDIKALYLLFFQIISYPIFDTYRVLLCFIPVVGYFLSKLKLVIKITRYAFIIFIIILFSTNIYQIFKNNNYPNDTTVYKYRNIDKNTEHQLNIIKNYMIESEKVYIIDENAYFIKLELEEPITKYDLLNDGNMGKDGHVKIIKGIENNCKEKKCLFLMKKEEINNNTLSQTNQDIINYVNDNYKEIDKISVYTVYENEVIENE